MWRSAWNAGRGAGYIMIDFTPHCSTSVHCQKCQGIPANQRRIFGVNFPCPYPQPQTEEMLKKQAEYEAELKDKIEARQEHRRRVVEFAEARPKEFGNELFYYNESKCCKNYFDLEAAVKKHPEWDETSLKHETHLI